MQTIRKYWRVLSLVLAVLFPWCNAAAEPDFDALEKSVVRIVKQTNIGAGAGTGFVINNRGYIATNVHVIAGGRVIKAIPTNSNTMYDVDVIAVSDELDLAIVRAPGINLPPVTLSLAPSKKGQKVWVIGYPSGADRNRRAHDPLCRMALLVEFLQVPGRYKDSGLFNTTRQRTPVIAVVLCWTIAEE